MPLSSREPRRPHERTVAEGSGTASLIRPRWTEQFLRPHESARHLADGLVHPQRATWLMKRARRLGLGKAEPTRPRPAETSSTRRKQHPELFEEPASE